MRATPRARSTHLSTAHVELIVSRAQIHYGPRVIVRSSICVLVLAMSVDAHAQPRTPAAPTAPVAPAKTQPTPAKAPPGPAKAPSLFPETKRGWKAVDKAEVPKIERFARDYLGYLADAKTPRRAVRGLVRLFKPRGKQLAARSGGKYAVGSRLWFRHRGGDAAAFIRVGQRPLEEGARIIIAAVDAPRIDLKQQPVYSKVGLTMLDTNLYGKLDLKSWLSRPLALYVHAKKRGGVIDLALGEKPTDPVLVIPDLLPHLSRKAQAKKIIDKPERMDALAARKRTALLAYLRTKGVTESVFQTAEASLVPAGAPSFVGVDRALMAGYGHSQRALAFSAVRGLLDAPAKTAPYHTAIVIVVSKSRIGYTGATGLAFVKTAMSRIIGALASEGANTDILGVRRIYARSAALLAADRQGKPNLGLVLNPRGDDALPRAIRRVLDAFRAAKAQYQLMASTAWGSKARTLATLDMDVVDVGLPITGQGTPMELLSTLDLFQAKRAFAVWLTNK